MSRPPDLLGEIEHASLDSSTNLADVLRKCIALGGATGSAELRAWASQELKGYVGEEVELPHYRQIPAPLQLDAAVPGGHVTGQQVPYSLIPDVAQERLAKPVPITMPVGEIVDLISNGRRKGEDAVKLGIPGGDILVTLMNSELHDQGRRSGGGYGYGPSQQIDRIYWSVSLSSMQGILDVVRTSLVELVAELRAGMRPGETLPSAAVTGQAVGVAIKGNRNRVVVQQVVQGDDGAPVTVAGGDVRNTEPESRARQIMWWLVGIATIVAGVCAVIVLR